MKKLITLLILTFALTVQAKGIYDFKLKTTSDKELDLKNYEKKAILFVNIATKCGYTGQLDGLEKIYQKYKEKDLVVIGIPSNDFGGQTPENNQDVAKFCKLNYGVTFPLTQKTKVIGETKSELYKYLLTQSDNNEIEWNFTKFLFDKNGKLVKRYPSSTSPSNEEFIKDIENSLK